MNTAIEEAKEAQRRKGIEEDDQVPRTALRDLLDERDKRTLRAWEDVLSGVVYQVRDPEMTTALLEWSKNTERKEEKQERVLGLIESNSTGSWFALNGTADDKEDAITAVREWNVAEDNLYCKSSFNYVFSSNFLLIFKAYHLRSAHQVRGPGLRED